MTAKGMTKALLSAGMALSLAGCSYGAAPGVDAAPAPLASVELVTPPERDPSELQVLFWSDEQRSARFREMENWFGGHEVPSATTVRELPEGAPLPAEISANIRAAMAETGAAGVMVYHNGTVRFEDYELGFGPEQRWTSFSVAKSFTSTLLGAAVADGFITSLDDPVITYVPELAGSSYDGVTVRQIATMTSGVAWNEDYTDPNSDVAAMNTFVLEYGPNAMVEQLKRLGRDAEPGTQFSYKTGETNLIGMVVENAVGLSLAEYAQEKIVEPAGFEGGLFWMTDPRGGNIGGCCLSLKLADYTRMGVFALEGDEGPASGIVPAGWFNEAGDSLVDFGDSGFGYGYQWWTYPGGYGAQGIFGQSITIIPEAGLVLTVVGNWPTATSGEYRAKWGGIAAQIAATNQ
ncbi:MAG: serine hydrolase domain-containing protein [Pseudomonadota bacterium]